MKDESGFTLVEVLLATAIMAVILTVLYTLFSNLMTVFGYHQNENQIHEDGVLALSQITEEISCAFLSESNKKIVFVGDENGLHFFTTSTPEARAQAGDLKERTYGLEPDPRSPSGLFLLKGNDDRVAAHLKRIRFQYYDGQHWMNAWDSRISNQLPAGVQVSLYFVDKRGQVVPLRAVVKVALHSKGGP
ncbi:MAG: prepilin-type N-terminal cleavage/methylation domain-containing protein [bacterium]